MKKIVISAFTIFFIGNAHAVKKPIIDDHHLKRSKLEKQLGEECKYSKRTNIEELYKCNMRVLKVVNEKMPRRGTDNYCNRQYSSLSKEAAKRLIVNLRKQREQARSMIYMSDKINGEIFEEELNMEVRWLRKNILKEELMMYDDRGF
ncbi:hypothetical protein [Zooshikella sp. RANM57]|uniref:hypothetical protein n=1 Tax=Zooshikella sp. RANM57 TaxID=3425863 RepID=UPI003D6F3FD5